MENQENQSEQKGVTEQYPNKVETQEKQSQLKDYQLHPYLNFDKPQSSGSSRPGTATIQDKIHIQKVQKMRNKLYDYVEQIIERQNKDDPFKNYESFQVETTCRKVFKELIKDLEVSSENNQRLVNQMLKSNQAVSQKQELLDKALTKVLKTQLDTESINSRLGRLEVMLQIESEQNNVRVDETKDRLETLRRIFESKTEVIKQYDIKINRQEAEAKLQTEKIHQFKDQINTSIGEVKISSKRQTDDVLAGQRLINQELKQHLFRLEKNQNNLRKHDASLGVIQSEFENFSERIESELSLRIKKDDLRHFVDRLRNLESEVRDFEKVKHATLDAIAYTKYFNQVNQQMLICDNVLQGLLNEDQREQYLTFHSQKLNNLINEIKYERSRILQKEEKEEVYDQGEIKDIRQDSINKSHIKPKLSQKSSSLLQTCKILRKGIILTDYEGMMDKYFNAAQSEFQKSLVLIEEVKLQGEIKELQKRIDRIIKQPIELDETYQKRKRGQSRKEMKINEFIERDLIQEKEELIIELEEFKFLVNNRGVENIRQSQIIVNGGNQSKLSNSKGKASSMSKNIEDWIETTIDANGNIQKSKRKLKGQINNDQEGLGLDKSQLNLPSQNKSQFKILQELRVSNGINSILDQDSPKARRIASIPAFDIENLNERQIRKLSNDLKKEFEQLIESIVPIKIEELALDIRSQLRNQEFLISQNQYNILERFEKEVAMIRHEFTADVEDYKTQIQQDYNLAQKLRIRDKSDFTAMMIENLNMQIQAEEQDLFDKAKMNLLAMKDKQLSKTDIYGPKLKQSNEDLQINSQNQQKNQQIPIFGVNQKSRQNSSDYDKNQVSTLIGPSLNQSQNVFNPDLPIVINKTCLSCQVSGHDTSQILKLFKVACLNYKASDVIYRERQLTRENILKVRKIMVDRMDSLTQQTNLFQQLAIYPKRFFDDIILEDGLLQNQLLKQITSIQHVNESSKRVFAKNISFGIGSDSKMQNLCIDKNPTTLTFNEQKQEYQNQHEEATDREQNSIIDNLTGEVNRVKVPFNLGFGPSRQLRLNNISHLSLSQNTSPAPLNTTRNLHFKEKKRKNYASPSPQLLHASIINTANNIAEISFDIDQIIRNPNSHIRKHTHNFQQLKNQTSHLKNRSILDSSNLPLDTSTFKQKIKVQNQQDLPVINK